MNNLKKLRLERGITQSELASMLGLTQSNVSRIENDEVQMTLKTALTITQKINCTIDELIGKEEDGDDRTAEG